MLILGRRIGERIMIGKDITITLIGSSAGRATIGVDAPLSVTVHREEVMRRIALENAQADARREPRV